MTYLFDHPFWLSHFLWSSKEAKVITLPKTDKVRKFPKNLYPIRLLSTTSKLQNVTLKTVRSHVQENNLLNANKLDFHARQNTTLQCVRLMDHVTLNFNNMSEAAVFLAIEKAFGTTLHPDLLHKLSKFALLGKHNQSYYVIPFQQKFRATVESELSTLDRGVTRSRPGPYPV
jgi:hypothetical protein